MTVAERRFTVRSKPGPLSTAYRVVKTTELTLPDGRVTFAKAGDYVVSRGSAVIEVLAQDHFWHLYESTEDGILSLPGHVRGQIEKDLGIGSTETPEHLAAAVSRLARLSVGNIEIDFTPGQWEDLAHRAKKRGIPTRALLQQIVDRITSELWNYASA